MRRSLMQAPTTPDLGSRQRTAAKLQVSPRLSNTVVAGRLGLVGHMASSGSWGSCPSGHSLAGRPCQVVAARIDLEDDPRQTGSQSAGVMVSLRSVDSLVLELDAHLLVGHLPD